MNLSNANNYSLYLWEKAQPYRGCMLVVERFEGQFYPHYFDQFGDAAILAHTPCESISAALDVARIAVDEHIEQAAKDGEHLSVLAS